MKIFFHKKKMRQTTVRLNLRKVLIWFSQCWRKGRLIASSWLNIYSRNVQIICIESNTLCISICDISVIPKKQERRIETLTKNDMKWSTKSNINHKNLFSFRRLHWKGWYISLVFTLLYFMIIVCDFYFVYSFFEQELKINQFYMIYGHNLRPLWVMARRFTCFSECSRIAKIN